MHAVFLFIVICFHSVLSLSGDGFEVLQPPPLAGTYAAGRLAYHPETFNVTGTLVQASPFDACKPLKNADFIAMRAQNDSVIILFQDGTCSYSTQLSNLQKIPGIQGYVMVRLDASVGSGVYSASDDLVLVGVEISKNDGDDVVKALKQGPVEVRITNPSTNTYADQALGAAGIAFRVIFCMATLASMVLSIYKITGYIQSQGFKPSFPQVCLSIEVVLALVRFVMLVDPFFTGDIIDIRVSYAIFAVQYFLLNTAIMLVAFYWQEALQSIKMDTIGLHKMKIPAGVVLGIWWIMCIVIIILLGLGYLDIAQILYSSAYFFAILFAGYFAWTCFKILRVLRKNKGVSIGRKHLRMTIMILLTTFGIVVNIFSCALYLTPMHTVSIQVTIGLTGLNYISFYIISFAQIMVFQAPQRTNWFCCAESSLIVKSPTSNEEHPPTTTGTATLSLE